MSFPLMTDSKYLDINWVLFIIRYRLIDEIVAITTTSSSKLHLCSLSKCASISSNIHYTRSTIHLSKFAAISAPLSLLSLSLISLLSSLPISLPQAAAPSLPCALSPKAGSHPFECLPVFSHAVAPPLYPLAGGAISPSPRLSIWSDVKLN